MSLKKPPRSATEPHQLIINDTTVRTSTEVYYCVKIILKSTVSQNHCKVNQLKMEFSLTTILQIQFKTKFFLPLCGWSKGMGVRNQRSLIKMLISGKLRLAGQNLAHINGVFSSY